jgi:glucose-1-phosphate cytidylyltransferase
MKAVILAGGQGTRISEETSLKPKPMIEIGGKPILWHIMKTYSFYGLNDFVICLGHKGYVIKEYFTNYFLHNSDVTIDIHNNKLDIHQVKSEDWKITLIDTGENTMTGGRVKRIEKYIDDTFCLTYGDGVGNINIQKLIEFHKKMGTYSTLTGVQPPGRFGALGIEGDKVVRFHEKPKGDNTFVNGGFFVFEPEVFDFIKDDKTILEKEPLEKLAQEKQLSIYKHDGFWQPMDTLRDKNYLEESWKKNPIWKVWK